MQKAITATARRATRWPGLCAVCRGFDGGRVCAACIARFAAPVPRCRRCALPVAGRAVDADDAVCGACLVDPPAFDAAAAAVDYAFPWDRLIASFKFHDALDLADAFATALAGALARAPAPAPDCVVPVPLAAGRLRERGYNQAWELARRIAGARRWRADPALLLRIRDTPHQLALPPAARAANVHGAFAVEPARRAEVAGRRMLVVDDVMTTASTASEIARVLRAAGAAHVAIAVLARTPRPE